jgi:hypothetical protein
MCQADQYEKALAALGSLISGTKRSHGEKWQHAYEGMRVFLEVNVARIVVDALVRCACSQHAKRSCARSGVHDASSSLRSVWTLQIRFTS